MMQVLTFQTDPFLTKGVELRRGKRALEREQLLSKIQGFQARTSEAFQKTDRIREKQDLVRHEQEEMRKKTAVRIEREQENLKLAVRNQENQQAKIDQIKRAVAVDVPRISFDLKAIRQLWENLSPLPAVLTKDQGAIGIKLKVIDQKQQAIRQQALIIQHNGAAVQQNLLAAAQKADLIQQHVNGIQNDFQDMGLKADQMEEKKEELKQQVEQLLELQQEELKLQGIKNEVVVTQKETVGLWTAIAQKIMEYSSWFFAMIAIAFAGGGVDIKKILASYQIFTPSDAINHPAAWVMLGGIACAIIRNTAFSIACMTLEGTLFYYRWKQNAKSATEQAI